MSRHSLRDWGLALEAAVWLTIAWLALRLLPFRYLAGTLRPRVKGTGAQHPANEQVIGQVCWAIEAAARRSPINMVCFPRAIAAQRMLARRGVATRLCVGVRRKIDGSMTAHAWIDVNHTTILGNPTTGFKVITTFSTT